MKTIMIFLCLSIFISLSGTAQNAIAELSIGDYFPKDQLAKKINLPMKSWAGKHLILTFWSPSCGGCYKELERIESLQRILKNTTLFILITKQNLETVNSAYNKVKIKKPDLTMIYSDSIFSRMLPYKTVSHNIWISPDNKIKFITDGEYLNTENLGAFIKGSEVEIPVKKELIDFDNKASLWEEGNGRFRKKLLGYSFFMDRIEGIGSGGIGFYRDSLETLLGLKLINSSLLFMYQAASVKGSFQELLKKDRVVLEVNYSDSLLLMKKFCYESFSPGKTKAELFDDLYRDLKTYFPFVWSVEKRKIPCITIKKTAGEEKPGFIKNLDQAKENVELDMIVIRRKKE